MSRELDNLAACLISLGTLARFGIDAPPQDAHVRAYHAERDRAADEAHRRGPRVNRNRKSNRC